MEVGTSISMEATQGDYFGVGTTTMATTEEMTVIRVPQEQLEQILWHKDTNETHIILIKTISV